MPFSSLKYFYPINMLQMFNVFLTMPNLLQIDKKKCADYYLQVIAEG